jgi:hypothetical protein
MKSKGFGYFKPHPVWGQGAPRPMHAAERAERIAPLQPLLR